MQAPIRTVLSSLAALIGTAALVFMMTKLIELTETTVDDPEPPPKIDLVRVREEAPPKVEQQKRPTPPPNLRPPDPTSNPLPDLGDAPTIPVNPVEVPKDDGIDIKPGGIGEVGDRPLTPVVRVEPTYPPIAASRGITGWVVVQFTITASGRVKNVRVANAKPARIFDDAAVQAVRRWQYKPRIVDGKPVSTPNQKTKLTFNLE